VHYKRGGTTQQCAGTVIYFYNNNGRNKQHNVSGKQTFTSSSGSHRFPVRETTSSMLSELQRNTDFYEPERLLTQQTHTKGGTPNNRQTKGRDRPPPRPATHSPRLLSLSQFSSRRDIQPRGALPAAARLDSCDGIRVLSSLLPPQPAPLALFCVQIDRAAVDAGMRGRARGRVVAGSLVLLGLSDLPYPPGLCGTAPIYPLFLARGAHVCFALHRSLGAHPRGVERGGLGSARWSETERKETGLKGTEEHRTLVVAGRPLGRGACAAGFP
jgi:hypothetical protein